MADTRYEIYPLNRDIGALVRSLRSSRGESQRALAERGRTTQSYIDRIEHNQIDVRISTLVRILEALGYRLAVVPDRQMNLLSVPVDSGKEDLPLIDTENLP